MIGKEKNYQPTPGDVELFKETLDVLVARGESRDEARKLLNVLQNPNGLGVSTDHVAASKRMLSVLLNRPYIPEEETQYLNIALNEEAKIAQVNWRKRKQAAALAFKKTVRLAGAGLVLFSTVTGTKLCFDQYNQNYNSPEAIAQRAAEANQKEQATISINAMQIQRANEQREDQLKREQDMTLGLSWTKASEFNWKFKYLPPNPNINFETFGAQGISGLFGIGRHVSLKNNPGEERHTENSISTNLRVSVHAYPRLDGKVVPMLKILGKDDKILQEVILRTEPAPDMDTRVIFGYDTGLSRERYFKIEIGPSPSQEQILVTSMKSVPKG
jgi:hypothetical protein